MVFRQKVECQSHLESFVKGLRWLDAKVNVVAFVATFLTK